MRFPEQTHFVYRLFSGYELLYVGCTSQPERRLQDHARTKPWWPQVTSWQFIGPLPKPDALILETALHDLEQPRDSRSGKDVGRIAASVRLTNIAAAHAEGRTCPEPRCHLCRARNTAKPRASRRGAAA